MNPNSENASKWQIRHLTRAITNISQKYEVRLEGTQRRLKKHRYWVVAINKVRRSRIYYPNAAKSFQYLRKLATDPMLQRKLESDSVRAWNRL